MAELAGRQGYFSILRWRDNPTRDEAKNIGIVLVDAEGEFAGIRRAPPSYLSRRLGKQGMIDAMLEGFKERFEAEEPPNLQDLEEMRGEFVNSLVFSEPKKVLVTETEDTLETLYRAYIMRRTAYSRDKMTKGDLTNLVSGSLRDKGYKVEVGRYINDFIFDAVITDPLDDQVTVTEHLSFANPKKTWTNEEHDAGHFLYAKDRIKHSPLAVVQPPTTISLDVAVETYQRVMGWFSTEGIEVVDPEEVSNGRFPKRDTF